MQYLLKQPKLSFSFIIESHHQQDCLKFQWAAIKFYELQLLITSRSWKYILYLYSLLQALCFPRIPIYTREVWIMAILSILDSISINQDHSTSFITLKVTPFFTLKMTCTFPRWLSLNNEKKNVFPYFLVFFNPTQPWEYTLKGFRA